MRENRPYGSEGGESGSTGLPYPYPDAAEANPLFAKKPPKIDWGWMLVVGVFAGAWISSRLSGDRHAETVPPLWADRFGSSVTKRFVAAFAGGLLMMLGARLAGGCTSGHGISGSLQLAVSSWMFVVVAFSAGIFTANLAFAQVLSRHLVDAVLVTIFVVMALPSHNETRN